MMDIRDYMNNMPTLAAMLQELPSEIVDRIKIVHLKAGDAVIEHCESNAYVYVILKGVCFTLDKFASGKRIILHKSTVSDVIGFSSIFELQNDFQASIFAKTQVTLAVIPLGLVKTCFGNYRGFSVEITSSVMRRLHSTIQLLSECNTYPLKLGLVTYLIHAYRFYMRQHTQSFNGEVKVLESRSDLANFLGVDVRSIHRAISSLRDFGYIIVKSGHIYISRIHYESLLSYQDACFLEL
jgi:CRP-like cAMP-binding protein